MARGSGKGPQRPVKLSEISKSDLKLFVSYFKPHLHLFFADILCATFIAGVDIAFPILSRYTINSVLPQYKNAPESTLKTFVLIIALCFGIYIFRTLCHWFVTFFGHVFGVRVEADMRRDIFSHIQSQSFSFFDTNRTGHLMSSATYDLFEVSELAHHGPEDLFISFLTLAGAFTMLVKIRWEMGLLVCIALPLMILWTFMSRKSLMYSSAGVKEKTALINTEIESSISGSRVTKIFTNENYEKRRFGESNREFVGAKSFYYKAMASFHAKMEFATHILNVIVLAVGGFFIMKGKMTVGDLVATNLFVAAFLQPIRRLTNFIEQFSSGMAGFMRFSKLLHTHDETVEKENAEVLANVQGKIEYKNVSFAYSNGIEILRNINLSLEKGKVLALVGASGGGKTTLSQLLPRFYEISGGSITIDGKDIRDVTVKSLRQNIGFVQQDVFLFAGSVKDNIAYGRPDATDEEIIEAAKKAEIYDDIMKMEKGFDTIVGERGLKLSGGQKQRVSIARVFLKNPPILILDEATSALDSVTETKIQSAFDELSKGRTTIIIAHRLSTVRYADKIVVIKDKEIAESGTHEELMELNRIYAGLYTAQGGNY